MVDVYAIRKIYFMMNIYHHDDDVNDDMVIN